MGRANKLVNRTHSTRINTEKFGSKRTGERYCVGSDYNYLELSDY